MNKAQRGFAIRAGILWVVMAGLYAFHAWYRSGDWSIATAWLGVLLIFDLILLWNLRHSS